MRLRRFVGVIFLSVTFPLVVEAQPSNTVCLPQFVDGASGPLRWQTTLMIHNQEMIQNQIRLRFYRSDGQPLQMIMNERERSRRRIQAGSNGQAGFDLDPRNAVSLRSMGQGSLQVGSCLVDAPVRFQVQATLHVYDTQGNLIEETGIVPHSLFTGANVFIDQSDDAAVGMSLANPGEQSVVATLEFVAEDGTTVLGSLQVTLSPHSQIARFVRELFPAFPDGIGFIRITTTSPVCGMALRLRGLNLSQLPVFINH
jgi:hypothetical protein